MTQVFIASKLPQEALDQLTQAGIQFDYWDSLTALTDAELIERLQGKTVLICGINVTINANIINNSPGLKLIANVGDGYSNIDLQAAKLKGLQITNAPTIDSIASTAEETVTLLLSLSRQILAGNELMRAHAFKGWQVTGYVGGHQVYGKKLVIVGMGRIGKVVAQMLSGFNMDMYYVDPVAVSDEFAKQYNLQHVSLEEGLKIADYLTVNCELTADNQHMFTLKEFSLMNPSAYFINCARGPLVKEADLVTALQQKKIAGAALDVYEFELEVSQALAELPNTVLMPHAGNATYEARMEMELDAVNEAIHYLQNKPLKYPVSY